MPKLSLPALTTLRGEIWWANLPDPSGSEPGFKRPIVVISSDSFNRSSIRTLIAVVITSHLYRANLPGNFLVQPEETGLPKASVVNVSQVVTLNKSYLTEQAGSLSVRSIQRLNAGLNLVLETG
jgi:mRNA interferase MazF